LPYDALRPAQASALHAGRVRSSARELRADIVASSMHGFFFRSYVGDIE
jgi:hypothetical protein